MKMVYERDIYGYVDVSFFKERMCNIRMLVGNILVGRLMEADAVQGGWLWKKLITLMV